MTKERLDKLSDLKKEVVFLTSRIRKIENFLTGRTSHIDGMPWVGGKGDMSGDLIPKLSDYKDELLKLRVRALDECVVLQQFIAGIEDSYIRQLFILRHIDGLTWQQISIQIGGISADSARMLHTRHLKALQIT